MKHIYVNLKRFDVPKELGGVNSISAVNDWAAHIINAVQEKLALYSETVFTIFFPEAHILAARAAKKRDSSLRIGCQGVFREDIVPGGNFGAFTTNRPAAAARALGCEAALIGHCEERKDLSWILAEAGWNDDDAIQRILNKEALCAVNQGLKVLYCVGETADQQEEWEDVLGRQLQVGLNGLNAVKGDQIAIAYEPVWAIGPGKTPPDRAYIEKIARFIKDETDGLPVVYGGGLKADNAAMLASIPEIDGGLIALTRFSGDIGFYPDEYLEIIRLYIGG